MEVNEHEYMNPNIAKLPKQERAIPKLKEQCLKYLESPPTETLSMIIISVYAFFVIFWLTHQEFFPDSKKPGAPPPIDENILIQIDNGFLFFFLSEIVLKTFASNMIYLQDYFSCFDSIIVLASLILNMIGYSVKGLGVLRLIRVMVIIMNKITGSTSKLKHKQKNENAVSHVISIIRQIAEQPEASNSVKREALWAIDLIESNKIFEINFDMNNEQKSMDMDAKAWLNITTEVANDTSKWFERDLDDFLKEIHRDNDEPDP